MCKIVFSVLESVINNKNTLKIEKYKILGIRGANAPLFLGCALHSLLHFHSF